MRTFGERQANPACDKATIEVTMSNNHDVSGSLTLLFPLSMILTNLLRAEINKASDIAMPGNARHQ
jgi:hypothetical protein